MVTDPAGHWKLFITDVIGNLTAVVEPNPALSTQPGPPSVPVSLPVSSSYFQTTYGYDVLNHLVSVSTPRNGVTQTRTFNYGTPPGAFLINATNPENGMVTYTYSNGRVTSKTDAKNQQTQYRYDGYGRLKQVRHYPIAGGAQDTTQQVNYYYDTNPFDTVDFSHYTAGRLAAVTYTPALSTLSFAEWYSYGQVGMATKRLQGKTYINSFAKALQPHYNEHKNYWIGTLNTVYASVLKWRVICDQ